MQTTAQDKPIQRVVAVGALLTLILSGLLSGARLLVVGTPATVAPIAVVDATATVSPLAAHMASASLPTIALASPTAALASPTVVGRATVAQAVSHATPAATQIVSATDLAPRLLKQLNCLAPGTRHDAALDAVAVERAQHDDTTLPKQGAIQIGEPDGQRILISAPMLTDLQTSGTRCGEILIFGIPPLDWLPNSTRFGLGVDARAHGAVIVVVTH